MLSTDLHSDVLPSEDDVKFYEEHGWYVARNVVDPDGVDRMLQASWEYYEGHRDRALPVSNGFADWKKSDGSDCLRNNELVTLQSDKLRELALQPRIGAISAKLARTSEIRLLDDQLVYKPKEHDEQRHVVGWHSDGAYWATCSSEKLLTAWIPMHDCGFERGGLVVIDGSHLWESARSVRLFNDASSMTAHNLLSEDMRNGKEIHIDLKKGDVSFHHMWTIHGSYANRSHPYRLSLAVHLQDGQNAYRSASKPDGTPLHMINERMCRRTMQGEPDFSDPAAFPTLWRMKN